MYDLSTQKVYIHIPKHNWVHINIDLHERQMTQGVYMYILKFDKNTHIHEMKTHTHKTNPKKKECKFKMYGSSKLDYTSTSNGNK